MRLAVDERHPDVDHRVAGGDALLHLGADALLDAGDELARHRAADDLVDELEPGARAAAARPRCRTTANWPWPPDCLTSRPWPLPGPAKVSRSDTRTGTESTATPYRLRSRSSSTSTCASPMHHSTSWLVSALRSSRMVGSSATRRPRPVASLSSSALRVGDDRHRQQRVGHDPRLDEQRAVLVRERVAGLGAGRAWPPRRCRRRSPARRCAASCPAGRTARRPARRRRGPRGRGRARSGPTRARWCRGAACR